MRYADTPTFQALNDAAKLADFNQWVKVKFFDEVDWDGRHVLGLAIPHGLRPGSRRDDWPPHSRTLWYVEMADGATRRVLVDVTDDDRLALPVIEGTPDETPSDPSLPPLVMQDDGYVIDGRHFLAAAKARGITDKLPTLTFDSLDTDEIERIRVLIPD